MRIVSFESSCQPGSLALSNDGKVVHSVELPTESKTTASFAPELKNCLDQSGWPPDSVDVFAICDGPGSFTGLRIGATVAKMFAYATGCQVVCVNSLHVLAAQAESSFSNIWAVLNAQRNQVFAAKFLHGQEQVPTQILDGNDWLQQLSTGDFLIGMGLKRYTEQLSAKDVVCADRLLWRPTATTLGELAFQKASNGDFQSIWNLTPKYYRRSAAEEKQAKK